MSFLFEGQVLYSLLGSFAVETSVYLFITMAAHLLGLFACGYFVKSPGTVRHVMVVSMGLCMVATAPFFFDPSPFVLARNASDYLIADTLMLSECGAVTYTRSLACKAVEEPCLSGGF